MTTDKQTSINLALSTINGKWKLSLMDELFQGTKRNGELMRALDGITQRVLTDRLREMEKDGLVHRESFNELPPRVEYTLTPEGYALTMPSLHSAIGAKHLHKKRRDLTNKSRLFLSILGIMGKLKIFLKSFSN